MSGWIGVDLDGTLAEYSHSQEMGQIGEPVGRMMDRVKIWLDEGRDVRIFTARASIPEQIPVIREWLAKHGLGSLPVTNVKDFGMLELWDDRAIQIVSNTGIRADGSY